MTESTSNQPTGYLLVISIGPVQEFIAASRKARDLWYGSDLLSELARHAATWLHNTGQVELIFPAPDAVDENVTDKPAVANKLLVHVKAGKPAALARGAREAVETSLRDDQWNDVWQRYYPDTSKPHPLAPVIDVGRSRQHLGGFVEWYAAWAPYDDANGDPKHYTGQRERAELLLAGRKALRDSAPAPGNDDGIPKSSLDPSRETVIQHDVIRKRADAERMRRRLRVKANEQLDGVSLLKRLGGTNRLVSVSRVAVDPFIRRASDDPAVNPDHLRVLRDAGYRLRRTDLVEWFNTRGGPLWRYRDFPFDCQLFYARSAADADTTGLSQDQVTTINRFCATVSELSGEVHGSPPAYFAVLVADGDRMGRAIRDLDSPGRHQTFSRELSRFARDAGETVRRHNGAMIYSGGDDVLAFLPLDTALPCAHVLNDDFQNVMVTALPDVAAAKRPTLSVGIAIGHYSEHLQVLLDRSRDAERAAKRRRNALAVSFTAHSGGGDTRTVTHSWNDVPVRNRWWFAIYSLHRDDIPDGAVYELDRRHRELAPLADHQSLTTHNLIAGEVASIIASKRTQGGREGVDKRVVEEIDRRLQGRDVKGQVTALRELIDELHIARKLLPAVRLGGGDSFAPWTAAKPGPGARLETDEREVAQVDDQAADAQGDAA